MTYDQPQTAEKEKPLIEIVGAFLRGRPIAFEGGLPRDDGAPTEGRPYNLHSQGYRFRAQRLVEICEGRKVPHPGLIPARRSALRRG